MKIQVINYPSRGPVTTDDTTYGIYGDEGQKYVYDLDRGMTILPVTSGVEAIGEGKMNGNIVLLYKLRDNPWLSRWDESEKNGMKTWLRVDEATGMTKAEEREKREKRKKDARSLQASQAPLKVFYDNWDAMGKFVTWAVEEHNFDQGDAVDIWNKAGRQRKNPYYMLEKEIKAVRKRGENNDDDDESDGYYGERDGNYDEKDCDGVNRSVCSRRLKRVGELAKSTVAGVGALGSKLYSGAEKIGNIFYDGVYPRKYYEPGYWEERGGGKRNKRTKRTKRKRTKRTKRKRNKRKRTKKRRTKRKRNKRRRTKRRRVKRKRNKRTKRRKR